MIVISVTVCIPQMVKASFPNDFSCQRKQHVATMPASSQMAIPFSTGAVKTNFVPKLFALDGQEGTKFPYPAENFGTKKPDKLISQTWKHFLKFLVGTWSNLAKKMFQLGSNSPAPTIHISRSYSYPYLKVKLEMSRKMTLTIEVGRIDETVFVASKILRTPQA